MAELRVTIVRPEDAAEPVDMCCVIDVLRATTTASVLCSRFGELVVVRSPAELRELPGSHYAVFSELSSLTTELPRYDNSPAIAWAADLEGRTPVLITTNGTISVALAAKFARDIVLASFVNLSAVVAYVRGTGAKSVAIMPAGHVQKAERCIEDDTCAETLLHRLRGEVCNEQAALAACRADPRIIRRTAQISADVEICFDVDAVPVVAAVVTAVGGWYLLRAQAGQNVEGTLR